MFGGVKSCGGGGSCIGGYLLWEFVVFVGKDCVGLWWVSGGDHGRSVVGFFGGVGYFGVSFSGGVVQVVGFVWHGSGGLWYGDCYLVWWKSVWSCGDCGKSAWSCVCGSVVGSDDGSISGFAFGLMIRWLLGYMGGGSVFTVLLWLFGSCLVVREK